LPAIDAVSLSPSGARFALVAREKDGRKLYVREADGKADVVAKLSDARVLSIVWAGDDHVIVFSRGTVGGRVADLPQQQFTVGLHLNLKTGAGGGLLSQAPNFLGAVVGWYGSAQIGGVWYAFVGAVPVEKMNHPGADDRVRPDLYRVNLETGQLSLVSTATSAGETRWVVRSDGVVAGRSTYDIRGRKFTLYEGAGVERPIYSRVIGPEGDWLAGQGRAPGALIVAVREGEHQTAREFRAGGPPQGELVYDDVDADQSVYDRTSGLFLGVVGQAQERLVDPNNQRRADAARKAFPGLSSTLVDYAAGFDRLIVHTDGVGDSGTYWLVDIARRSAVPIGHARPEIKDADVAPMRMVSYKAADGLAMEGVLTLPPGREAKGLPLVVIPHAGPVARGDRIGFDWFAQAAASRGYAVFQPNYRGTLGYGEAFRAAAQGEQGRKMQTDISDGVAELARQEIIDPKRVCIVGEAFGGYAALAGVTLQKGVYRCAAALDAYSDPRTYLIAVREQYGLDERGVRYWREFAGDAEGQALNDISPRAHSAEATAPILLIHGLDDPGVPVDQSAAMQGALKRAGKPVELVQMEKEDGHWALEPNRQAMLAKVVAFVEKYNPPN
jgi:dipeptidyl aminopeptidase/acylaminoacyl peptidase